MGSESSSNTVSGQLNVPSFAVQLIGLVIDGRTLMYALEESLKSKFLELAKLCQVVLCCRATPLQKVCFPTLFRIVGFHKQNTRLKGIDHPRQKNLLLITLIAMKTTISGSIVNPIKT